MRGLLLLLLALGIFAWFLFGPEPATTLPTGASGEAAEAGQPSLLRSADERQPVAGAAGAEGSAGPRNPDAGPPLPVRGRILCDNQPVAGEVLVYPLGTLRRDPRAEPMARAAAGRDGRFALEVSEDVELRAQGQQLAAVDYLRVRRTGLVELQGVDLVVYRVAEVRGRVVDELDQGVAEAAVTSRNARPQLLRRSGPAPGTEFRALPGQDLGRSGADGRCSGVVPLHPDRMLSARLGKRVGAEPIGDGHQEVVITLPAPRQGFRIFGRVVDPQGQAIPGAIIRGPREVTRSGEDGSFEILLVPVPRRVRLDFTHREYGVGNRDLGQVTGDVGPLRLTLARGAQLSGRVVDAEGKPVEALVNLPFDAVDGRRWPDSPRNSMGRQGTFSDEKTGRFAFKGLEPGTYRLRANSGGQLAVGTFPVPGPEVLLRLGEIDDACVSIYGTVREVRTGKPIAGAKVIGWYRGPEAGLPNSLGVAEVRSDEQGRYSLVAAQTGRYRVEAKVPEMAPARSRTITVGPGEARLDIEVWPACDLRVRILDLGGRPVAGAIVKVHLLDRSICLLRRGTGRTSQMRSGADGVAHLRGLPTRRVRVSATPRVRFPGADLEVDLSTPPEAVLDLRLAYHAPRGEFRSLYIRLLDSQGAPAAVPQGCGVEVFEGARMVTRASASWVDGAFVTCLPGQPEGWFKPKPQPVLQVWVSSQSDRARVVVPGRKPLVLKLPPGGRSALRRDLILE